MVRLISISAVVLLFGLLSGGAFLFKKKGWELSGATKPLALVLALLTFVRYIYDRSAVYYIRGLDSELSPFNNPEPRAWLTGLAVILLWFSYAAMLTTVFNEFFEYKTLRNIVTCFSMPVYLIVLIFFNVYAVTVLGTEGYSLSNFRLWIMVAEIALAMALTASHAIVEGNINVPRSKEDTVSLLYALPFAIISIMPCYVPQAFFVTADPNIRLFDLTAAHRLMLYFAIILPFIIFHFMKNKPQDVKRFLMIYLSIALMWVYLGRWNLEAFKNPLGWPLHLCNTAMFIIPICLIFRLDKLFNFCLFINVLGAFMAMVIPGKLNGLNAIGTERISFWVNHYAAFFLPVLLVALKVFRRPKFKEWIYSVVALTFYFISILFINAWFTNYGECDFFFVNSDFIVSGLGEWARRTRDFTVSFQIKELTFTFYPVYQALFYVVYIGFTVGMWFLYELLFSSWDKAEDRRLREKDFQRMKKELKEYLGDRTIHEPVSGDSSPRLILNNFSKRYGSNKHYSVKDACLDVRGGEIFGFLGPNGAGKSTIIKSVVGIQTITSGEIDICGFNVEKQPVQAKLNTGFVPDHYALYENLTGREYINYIADLFQVSFEARNEVIERLVERFQLTGSFDNQMKTYSHGMKQKIALMSALVHNPKVWILDEPLTGLDPTSVFEVKECMREHAAKGNIVFFSSHIIDVVEKICDRIAIIKKGRIRACVSLKELEEKGIELERFYLDIINDGDDAHPPVEEEILAKEAAKQ